MTCVLCHVTYVVCCVIYDMSCDRCGTSCDQCSTSDYLFQSAVDAEVKQLLALKAKFKEITGEWVWSEVCQPQCHVSVM